MLEPNLTKLMKQHLLNIMRHATTAIQICYLWMRTLEQVFVNLFRVTTPHQSQHTAASAFKTLTDSGINLNSLKELLGNYGKHLGERMSIFNPIHALSVIDIFRPMWTYLEVLAVGFMGGLLQTPSAPPEIKITLKKPPKHFYPTPTLNLLKPYRIIKDHITETTREFGRTSTDIANNEIQQAIKYYDILAKQQSTGLAKAFTDSPKLNFLGMDRVVKSHLLQTAHMLEEENQEFIRKIHTSKKRIDKITAMCSPSHKKSSLPDLAINESDARHDTAARILSIQSSAASNRQLYTNIVTQVDWCDIIYTRAYASTAASYKITYQAGEKIGIYCKNQFMQKLHITNTSNYSAIGGTQALASIALTAYYCYKQADKYGLNLSLIKEVLTLSALGSSSMFIGGYVIMRAGFMTLTSSYTDLVAASGIIGGAWSGLYNNYGQPDRFSTYPQYHMQQDFQDAFKAAIRKTASINNTLCTKDGISKELVNHPYEGHDPLKLLAKKHTLENAKFFAQFFDTINAMVTASCAVISKNIFITCQYLAYHFSPTLATKANELFPSPVLIPEKVPASNEEGRQEGEASPGPSPFALPMSTRHRPKRYNLPRSSSDNRLNYERGI